MGFGESLLVSDSPTTPALPPAEGTEVWRHTLLENLLSLVKNISSGFPVKNVGVDLDRSMLGGLSVPVRNLTICLSNWAYSALDRNFQIIISPGRFIQDVSAASPNCFLYHHEPCSLHEFCLHLRSCISLLFMLEFDINLMMEKIQMLVNLLKALCCPDDGLSSFYSQTVGNETWSIVISNLAFLGNADEDLSGLNIENNGSNPLIRDVLSIVEVLVDELLVHDRLRAYMTTLYHVSIPRDDETIIMELLSAHYVLSYRSGANSFGQLFQSAISPIGQRLSLTAAVALLGMAELNSAPPMLLAHLLLLISQTVIQSRDLDRAAVDCYLAAFERSATLHSTPDRPGTTEFCVRRGTIDLVNACRLKFPEFHSTDGEYLAENLGMVAEPWREESCEILDLFLRAGDSQRGIVDGADFPSTDEAIWVAAARLRLMGSSLFRVAAVVRRSDGEVGRFVRGIAGRAFPWAGATSPMCGMLAYLSRWFWAGTAARPIQEGCVWTMLAVLNLMGLEEGGMDLARAMLIGQFPLSRPLSVGPARESSVRIASNLRKLQSEYLKEGGLDRLTFEPSRGDGKEFLRWVTKEEDLDDDDLADFIDVKPGKNYGQWLKSRQRYNKWRQTKSMAVSRARKLALWKKLAQR